MPVNEDYLAYIVDQLSESPEFTQKKMFGGVGFFHNGKIFGAIMKDVFRLKTDDSNVEDYTSRGMGKFEHGRGSMPYYEVPLEVLEDKKELSHWVKKSIALSKKK